MATIEMTPKYVCGDCSHMKKGIWEEKEYYTCGCVGSSRYGMVVRPQTYCCRKISLANWKQRITE